MTQQETTWRANFRKNNRERLNEASRINYHKTKAERGLTMALYRMRSGTRLRKITLDKLGLSHLPETYNSSIPVFKCFSSV
jgi:hypothetical protein